MSGTSVKWHRTEKSANFDYCFDATGGDMYLPFYQGGPLTQYARGALHEAVRQAREFWDRCRSLADLPDAGRWLRSYLETSQGLGFYNYTQAPLALAFSCAVNGQVEEARLEFQRFSEGVSYRDDVLARLGELLEQAISAFANKNPTG